MLDPEVAAINAVLIALKDLEPVAQQNVIDYAVRRFNLQFSRSQEVDEFSSSREPPLVVERALDTSTRSDNLKADALEGVSPIARKWISRSGLSADDLSKLFSLGIEEIDVISTRVPGSNKKDRMRSVILLKGIAAYLGTGAARIPHEQVKEACLHYDAFDRAHFATYLKSLSAEVGGTKESGYTLSARGISAATELLREMVKDPTK